MSICPKFFFLHLQLFLKRFQCQLRVICTWAHSQHGKLPGKPATVWLFGSLQPRVKREIPAAKGTLHCILAFLIQLISEELNLHVKITPGALLRLMSVGDHQELTATEKSSQPLSNPTWRFEKNVGEFSHHEINWTTLQRHSAPSSPWPLGTSMSIRSTWRILHWSSNSWSAYFV